MNIRNVSQIEVGGHLLDLVSEKAVMISYLNTILIADIHLGKIEHFRNQGIAIPHLAAPSTLDRLQSLMTKYQPTKVVFLGDLFHSVKNKSFHEFGQFIQAIPNVEFTLVVGNHDIYSTADYNGIGLHTVDELYIGNLWLTHEHQPASKPGFYNLAGHIHPGVRLKGIGKQSLSLPCFVFYPDHGILPAFGYFTGQAIIQADKNSTIFAVTDDAVIPLST